MAQQVLTWLCILPPENSTSVRKKRAFKAFAFTIVAILTSIFIAGVFFIRKFALTDFVKCLFSFSVCLSCACIIYVAIVSYILRSKILTIFETLSEIYDTCKSIRINWKLLMNSSNAKNENIVFFITDKDEGSFRFLARANNKCEWIWRLYFERILGVLGLNHLFASVISVLLCYYNYGKFDRNHLYLPFNLV